MRFGAPIHVAFAFLLGITSAAAQEAIETRGGWRLVADGADFALRSQAVGAPDSMLSLACRRAQNRFAFEIKSPLLAAQPSGEDIRVGFKVDDDDQVYLTLATGPDGTVLISHQTAFWIVHGALVRPDAKQVAFTAGDHSWTFPLDGLHGLTGTLIARCGFDPPRSARERR